MKIKREVLAVLDRCACDGSQLVIKDQLDRKLYVDVAKVIEAAGGKWNRKAKAHLFPGDAADAIEPVVLTGEVISAKQEFGAFFTPPALAERVVALAKIEPGMRVLEPSAGEGALALPAVKAGGIVTCVEVLSQFAEKLDATGKFNQVIISDFLNVTTEQTFGLFDRVVMNPPFAKQADIKHMLHAARFLKPGGRLVAIMSAGVMFRQNALTTGFRDFTVGLGGTLEELPEEAFKSSGTSVNTVLVSFYMQEGKCA